MFKSAKLWSQILILYGLANVATSGSKFSWPSSSGSFVNSSQIFGMTWWYKYEWFSYIYFAVLTLLYIKTQIWYIFSRKYCYCQVLHCCSHFYRGKNRSNVDCFLLSKCGFHVRPWNSSSINSFQVHRCWGWRFSILVIWYVHFCWVSNLITYIALQPRTLG